MAAAKCPSPTDIDPKTDTETNTLHGRVDAITDGDTLTLRVGAEKIRIRLAQIDAPEPDQPHGAKSTAALSALALRKQARVEVVDIDRYGRSVGEVFVDNVDINHEMVRGGHAWAYTHYAHSTEIIELENRARAAKSGLWALPENEREPPWTWRHRAHARQIKPGPLACGTRTYCSEMASCEEARRYFKKCGAQSMDGDGDGNPCERLCATTGGDERKRGRW